MLKGTPIVSEGKDNELTFSYSSNKTNKVKIPPDLIHSVNNIIQKNIHKKNLLSPKEKVSGLWQVIIKPEFQEGLDKGILSMKDGSLEIRDVESGKYIAKANLSEVGTGKLMKATEPSALSTITNNIASISGQLQMAEISKKLDVMNEKIDLIGQFQWRDKVSEVHSLNSVIEEAIESLPNEHALQRINDSIIKLKHLANFFEETIKELLSKKISFNLKDNFIDGLKLWNMKKENRYEYNNKYNNDIQTFINEYGFLMDLYFQTLGLIGTCYQITNEYHHASKYFRKIEVDINGYSTELADKLIYLLNVEADTDIDDNSLSIISEKLKNRNLPEAVVKEIHRSGIKINEVNHMHKMLATQFEQAQISYEVEPKLLMEGMIND